MDECADYLLQQVASIPRPLESDSAWKYSYERIVASVACTIACRKSMQERNLSGYHAEIRVRLPDLLRGAVESCGGEWVDWRSKPLETWSAGLFLNDAQVRICSALEKCLRVATFMLKANDSVFRAASEANRKITETAPVPALVLQSFCERGVEQKLEELASLSSTSDVLATIAENAILEGWTLRYIWELVNNQKHRPGAIRSQKIPLQNSAVEWAITAAGIPPLCSVYTALYALDPGRSDADLDSN